MPSLTLLGQAFLPVISDFNKGQTKSYCPTFFGDYEFSGEYEEPITEFQIAAKMRAQTKNASAARRPRSHCITYTDRQVLRQSLLDGLHEDNQQGKQNQ